MYYKHKFNSCIKPSTGHVEIICVCGFRGGGVSIAKTLELLRAVLQTSFNQEVKQLCDSYLDVSNAHELLGCM